MRVQEGWLGDGALSQQISNPLSGFEGILRLDGNGRFKISKTKEQHVLTLGQAHWVEAVTDAAKRDLLSLYLRKGLVLNAMPLVFYGAWMVHATVMDGHDKRLV